MFTEDSQGLIQRWNLSTDLKVVRESISKSYREPEGKHPRPMGSKDTNLQKETCLARMINSRGSE